jgi:hypothetical protein
VRSDGSGIGLAWCGFYGHPAAKISFFEGFQDWFGDEFYLLEPVGAILLHGWRAIGRVDFGGEGGCGSGGQTAQEEAAAIRV